MKQHNAIRYQQAMQGDQQQGDCYAVWHDLTELTQVASPFVVQSHPVTYTPKWQLSMQDLPLLEDVALVVQRLSICSNDGPSGCMNIGSLCSECPRSWGFCDGLSSNLCNEKLTPLQPLGWKV